MCLTVRDPAAQATLRNSPARCVIRGRVCLTVRDPAARVTLRNSPVRCVIRGLASCHAAGSGAWISGLWA